ncbi:MAG: aspartate carbamoyltransferase catalytic subunit [Phycisphaeraceae bacterium]|nr:aspartate carbamoyltransferase catalytic subunit [Phycisphaerales bacterium]MCB9859558.1 aspartate carbamoyltransferase catalytic subunit [Phycisphaeraceae bacterium]
MTTTYPHDIFTLARAFDPNRNVDTEQNLEAVGGEGSLLQLRGMTPGAIRTLLVRAREFLPSVLDPSMRPQMRNEHLSSMTVALLFFEHSTRTCNSFAIAADRIGARYVNFSAANSSTNKGETIVDTARTIRSMGADVLVMRASQVCSPHLVAARTQAPVINAGDGAHEHPTQGLLDSLALANALDIDNRFDFSGRRILIVGDILHSRVARSATHALTSLGAHVTLCGPEAMVPKSLESLAPGQCDVTHDLDAQLGRADAVMMLRVQFERHIDAKSHDQSERDAFVRDYTAGYCLTTERAARMRPDAFVMHPGPFNRGIELESSVVDGGRSIIWHQVSCGVAVRMAVLEKTLAHSLETGIK